MQLRKAAKEYLRILEMASKEGEALVDEALCSVLLLPEVVAADVEMFVESYKRRSMPQTEVEIAKPDLRAYDALLSVGEAV